MKVDREGDFGPQGLDQLVSCSRMAESGHVFEGDDVGPHFFQLLGEVYKVLERVLVAVRIEDVAGIAHGGLADGLRVVPHRFHGDFEIRQIVERIEDPEDIHARFRGVLYEGSNDIVRVIGVAHAIGAAEKHLGADVGDFFPQIAEAQEGVLVEKAHARIEGRAAPAFEAVEIVGVLRHAISDLEHVVAAHASGQKRLVGIAKSGIRN